jgi:hypothetical protein
MLDMGKGKTFRPHGYVNRTLSIDPDLDKAMKARKDVNWSSVVEQYLKVYIFDLERGVPRRKGK